jgi:hypothetical protein
LTLIAKDDRITRWSETMPAEKLNPCCERALATWIARIDETVASFPVIQNRPCPTCKQIVEVRVYGPPEERDER